MWGKGSCGSCIKASIAIKLGLAWRHGCLQPARKPAREEHSAATNSGCLPPYCFLVFLVATQKEAYLRGGGGGRKGLRSESARTYHPHSPCS